MHQHHQYTPSTHHYHTQCAPSTPGSASIHHHTHHRQTPHATPQPHIICTRTKDTAVHCSITISNIYKPCNTLRRTATPCTTLHHTTPHCTSLHHTATHCTTQHHPAPHNTTLPQTARECKRTCHLEGAQQQWQRQRPREVRQAVDFSICLTVLRHDLLLLLVPICIRLCVCVCVCVCLCVCMRCQLCCGLVCCIFLYLRLCVCVCARERERESVCVCARSRCNQGVLRRLETAVLYDMCVCCVDDIGALRRLEIHGARHLRNTQDA